VVRVLLVDGSVVQAAGQRNTLELQLSLTDFAQWFPQAKKRSLETVTTTVYLLLTQVQVHYNQLIRGYLGTLTAASTCQRLTADDPALLTVEEQLTFSMSQYVQRKRPQEVKNAITLAGLHELPDAVPRKSFTCEVKVPVSVQSLSFLGSTGVKHGLSPLDFTNLTIDSLQAFDDTFSSKKRLERLKKFNPLWLKLVYWGCTRCRKPLKERDHLQDDLFVCPDCPFLTEEHFTLHCSVVRCYYGDCVATLCSMKAEEEGGRLGNITELQDVIVPHTIVQTLLANIDPMLLVDHRDTVGESQHPQGRQMQPLDWYLRLLAMLKGLLDRRSPPLMWTLQVTSDIDSNGQLITRTITAVDISLS
jgi:hypothetical protein